MNILKNAFTIKDLENLSGIKAHTIRVWEKRYGILEPMRTESNIRVYSMQSLQKLLNICTLTSYGYKISAIAKLPEETIPVIVREILSRKTLSNHALNSFKLAMINFDRQLFSTTYNNLLTEKSLSEIFFEFFVPLLRETGMLWQTGTITPAHEHFISCLIKQQISVSTEALQNTPPTKTDRTFVLYLPEGEIHEMGLMVINYELIRIGHQTVYIGANIPTANLTDIKNYFANITFVTYLTIETNLNRIGQYLSTLKTEVVNDTQTQLYVFGKGISFIDKNTLPKGIETFTSIRGFAEGL